MLGASCKRRACGGLAGIAAFGLALLGLAASADAQLNVPPELSAAGPVGNVTQEKVLGVIDALESGDDHGCGFLVNEDANFPDNNTYSKPTVWQLEVMQEIVEDLEATWEVIPQPNSGEQPYSLDQGVLGPKTFRRALEHKVLKELTVPNAPLLDRQALAGHFVVATACGKVLFKIKRARCDRLESLNAHYSDVDTDTIVGPFYPYWWGLRGENILAMFPSLSVHENRRHSTLYVLEPVQKYPASYSNAQIADHVIGKARTAAAWSVYNQLKVAEFVLQLMPTGAVWRTLLAKGVYQYETWDLAEDATQITADLALTFAGPLAQVKNARTASKLLWAAAATGVAARAGWNTYQNGRPTFVDVMRVIACMQVAVHLRGLSKQELADDVAEGLGAVKTAVTANPALASTTLAQKSKAAWRRDFYQTFIGSVPYVRTMDDVYKHMHAVARWLVPQRLTFLDTLSRRLLAQRPTQLDFDPSAYVAGLADELIVFGKQLEIRSVQGIGLSRYEQLLPELADLVRQHPTMQPDDIWRILMQEELYNFTRSTNNNYDAATKIVGLQLMQIYGNPQTSRLTPSQVSILVEELHYTNVRVIAEEVTHAMGDVAARVGYHTKQSMFRDTIDNRYVPLTVNCFNFESWLNQTPLAKIRELLPADIYADALATAASRNVSPKQILLSEIHEADIFFRLKQLGIPTSDAYIDGISGSLNYATRSLASRWLDTIAPTLVQP